MKTKISTTAILLLLLTGFVAAQSTMDDVATIINDLMCKLITLLWAIAAGIAAIVIVLAGIKWIGSSEDAGARAQAKSTIIHALIGLLIVMIALVLVNYVVSGTSIGNTLTFTC